MYTEDQCVEVTSVPSGISLIHDETGVVLKVIAAAMPPRPEKPQPEKPDSVPPREPVVGERTRRATGHRGGMPVAVPAM